MNRVFKAQLAQLAPMVLQALIQLFLAHRVKLAPQAPQVLTVLQALLQLFQARKVKSAQLAPLAQIQQFQAHKARWAPQAPQVLTQQFQAPPAQRVLMERRVQLALTVPLAQPAQPARLQFQLTPATSPRWAPIP